MNIKVIGTGCEKCDALYKNVQNAIKELDIDAEIEKVEDLIDIVKLGVMTSPSLMVDGKLVISGRVAKKEETLPIDTFIQFSKWFLAYLTRNHFI